MPRWGVSLPWCPKGVACSGGVGPCATQRNQARGDVCAAWGISAVWLLPRVASSAARAGGEGGVACLCPGASSPTRGDVRGLGAGNLGATWGVR